MRRTTVLVLTAAVSTLLRAAAPQITGELRQWHDVVLTFDGPSTSEAAVPNPFLQYRLNVTFTNGRRTCVVPGYFAADGNAAETSAKAGDKWRVHFVPTQTGDWTYRVSFRQGREVAVSLDPKAGAPLAPDGTTGKFTVLPSDKKGRDHRAKGMLRYVGEHYARYEGSGEYFIQVGSQSPENFLAYYEFDDTVDHGGATNQLREGLHRYEPHVRDWREGDPTWKGGKGKGIVGALNYLASKGMNTFYSLTMNIDGDGREIYPWTSYEERARYDVSKLAQWEIVFSHMDRLGMQLMLVTQEEENEQILGKMTPLRKLYYRELIARFAHHHAILWDLSEEADRWRYYTADDLKEICEYFKRLDPWQHPIQYVQWKGELLPDEKGYGRLLGYRNFDGTAMQHDPEFTHEATRKWVDLSAAAGHKWLVGIIEINPTSTGVVPDAADYWHDRVRKNSIWGNLMAGGSGQVHFFGYAHPNSDLDMEDWRSRDHFWDLLRYAHEFFTQHLPFVEMRHADDLTPDPSDFVFAKPGEVYAVYLPDGGAKSEINLPSGDYNVQWYNPRQGGSLRAGSLIRVQGGSTNSRTPLGAPPSDLDKDWAVLVRRVKPAENEVTSLKPAFPQERNVLVKLRHDIGTQMNRMGDRVDASIISPESFLGGFLEGRVESVSSNRLLLRFHTLRYKDQALSVNAVVTGFVNSKGHNNVDDVNRPLQVVEGGTFAGEFRLDEGAEVKLRALK